MTGIQALILAASQPSQRIEGPESAGDRTDAATPAALRGSIANMATAAGRRGRRRATGGVTLTGASHAQGGSIGLDASDRR
jgi:hypothetical protein